MNLIKLEILSLTNFKKHWYLFAIKILNFDTQVARRGRQHHSQPNRVLFHVLQTRGHEMVEANHPC